MTPRAKRWFLYTALGFGLLAVTADAVAWAYAIGYIDGLRTNLKPCSENPAIMPTSGIGEALVEAPSVPFPGSPRRPR